MIVAGVDEAGRGSVLGPLVVAAVSFREERISKLAKLGVKDSKLLAPTKRQKLFRQIKKLASSVACEKIPPQSIDRVVLNGERLHRLNYLEAQTIAKLLNRMRFDRVFVDCCDTNEQRFGSQICDLLAARNGKSFTVGEKNPLQRKVISEHRADKNYLVVSAASIVAKVTRDAAILKLSKKHGELGSGYPSDPYTVSYLKNSIEKSKIIPYFARRSWLTIRRMEAPESSILFSGRS